MKRFLGTMEKHFPYISGVRLTDISEDSTKDPRWGGECLDGIHRKGILLRTWGPPYLVGRRFLESRLKTPVVVCSVSVVDSVRTGTGTKKRVTSKRSCDPMSYVGPSGPRTSWSTVGYTQYQPQLGLSSVSYPTPCAVVVPTRVEIVNVRPTKAQVVERESRTSEE